MEKKVFELDFHGRKLVVEHGELAKQADGAVLVRYNDTVVLTASVVSKTVNLLSDFFPLTVNYQEKLYSVGKIPGGFIKREGRPSEAATLAARMIDRPMRPLFPEGFKNEVQIISTVLSVDQDCSPELTAMFASSLAVSISKIPFNGPIAGVKVGRVNGEFIINPTPEELENSELELTVAGTKDAINMVESSAKQVPEDVMLEALMFGHEAVKELIKFQEEIIKEIGAPKMEYETLVPEEEIVTRVKDLVTDRMDKALRIKDKLEKYAAIDALKEEVIELYTKENEDSMKEQELKELLVKVNMVLSDIEYELFRNIVVKEGLRADGRAMDEIRPLSTDIDLLPRTHGSALFTRGETQALSVTTLGALGEHQILDGLDLETEKRFMLHYNFPQFSVGETGRYGAPGRREIGHGALAEKALVPVLPSKDEFPYAIRVVSEILSSNGSTSQGSICGSTLSLMAAGVPIKEPVAGISTGLVTDENDRNRYVFYEIEKDLIQLKDPNDMVSVEWPKITCKFNYTVQGVFQGSTNPDYINCVSKANTKKLICAGDEHYLLHLCNYPCVDDNPKKKKYRGHSGKIKNIIGKLIVMRPLYSWIANCHLNICLFGVFNPSELFTAEQSVTNSKVLPSK